MAFAATADVERFDEAVEWWDDRFPVTEEIAEELGEYAGSRAWTIAGVNQLDAVLAAHELLTRAIEEGTPLDDMVEELGKVLEPWGFDGHRVESIARTNIQAAYNAGRYRQLVDPDLLEVRPYRQFDGIADFRQSDICRSRDGTTLPALDPWWLSNWPPLHHNCRSIIRSLAKWELTDVPSEKLEAPILMPNEESRGDFGLAPEISTPWRPNLDRYEPALAGAYRDKENEYISSLSIEEETT